MILRSAVRAACLIFGATAIAPGLVFAQNSPRSARGEELEEIIVTGSKLVRPDAVAPIPVTSVNAGEIEASGVTMISDYIRELPVFGINSGRTTETSGADSAKPLSTAGTERLNLRDLGVDRTLVVVDGRRHVGSTAGSTAVDVASIPTALIERVEISTGGASTAYGADAIAGVVNFITKKNFEGVQVDSRYGDSDQGGGENTYIALTVGGNFAENRGNAVFSASYNDIGGILGSQRKYVTDRWGFVANTLDTGPNDGIPSQILMRDTRFTNLLNHQGASFGLLDGSVLIFNDDGSARPFDFGDPATTVVGAVVGGDGLDPTTNANVATPMQRKSIFGSINYALTDKVNFFAEGKAYLSDAQVISPALLDAITYPENGELFFIAADNPFLPQNDPLVQQQIASNFGLITMSRWHDDFPLRYADIQRTLNRFVAGVEGDTGFKDWHFEIYGQYGHTNEEYREFNNRDPRRFRLSTDATTDVTGITGVAPGSPVCRSTLTAFQNGGTTDPDILACRPVNLFGRHNESQESLDYFLIDLLTNKSLEQTVASASLNGSLFDMPAGPVSFAAGLEYRKESSESIPDANQQQGKTFTGTTPAVKGSYDVSEAYIEARLPLLKDKPFADLLAIEGGFRASDYSILVARRRRVGGGQGYSLPRHVREVGARAERRRAVHAAGAGHFRARGSVPRGKRRRRAGSSASSGELYGDPRALRTGPADLRAQPQLRRLRIRRRRRRQSESQGGDRHVGHIRPGLQSALPAEPDRLDRLLRHRNR
jgi:iron complex outermembrane recepter protein